MKCFLEIEEMHMRWHRSIGCSVGSLFVLMLMKLWRDEASFYCITFMIGPPSALSVRGHAPLPITPLYY